MLCTCLVEGFKHKHLLSPEIVRDDFKTFILSDWTKIFALVHSPYFVSSEKEHSSAGSLFPQPRFEVCFAQIALNMQQVVLNVAVSRRLSENTVVHSVLTSGLERFLA